MDQSSFAAPHGFSQRITSFIACACQGIHQMPLRHLIVLIANAHHLAARFQRKRQQAGLPFTTPPIQQCHRRVRSDHLIGATPSSPLVSDLKTSFSRLNPGPRGQATAIKSSVRCKPEGMQTTTTQSDKLPSYLQSLHHIRPARPSMVSQELGSDAGSKTQHLEASRSIFSSRYMQNTHPT